MVKSLCGAALAKKVTRFCFASTALHQLQMGISSLKLAGVSTRRSSTRSIIAASWCCGRCRFSLAQSLAKSGNCGALRSLIRLLLRHRPRLEVRPSVVRLRACRARACPRPSAARRAATAAPARARPGNLGPYFRLNASRHARFCFWHGECHANWHLMGRPLGVLTWGIPCQLA